MAPKERAWSGAFTTLRFFPVLAAVILILPPARAADAPVVLTSPNGRLQARFAIRDPLRGPGTTDGGAFVYSVNYDGKPLIEPSALWLKPTYDPPLGTDVKIADATPGSGIDDYSLVAGKTRHVHDAYNSLRLSLAEPNPPGRKLIIEASAYDGGFAFRYIVPKQEAIYDGYRDLQDLEDFHLEEEHTEFRISEDAVTWALALPGFRSQYEDEYLRLNVTALSTSDAIGKTLIGLPLLIHAPGIAWMAIAEAGLEGNGAMYLTNPCGNCLTSKLAPRFDQPNLAGIAMLPHHSAWRVLLIGDRPGRLVESNIITSLNPPSRIGDTSWIHAGKSSWDWWSGVIGPDGKPAFNTKVMEYYVDFAARSGFRYMLVDAGWSAAGDITKLNGSVDLPALVKYAAAKNVKVWIWAPYKRVAAQMTAAFPLYEKWGIAGVKIDFVARDDQAGIQVYYDAAKCAAMHHLLLDFHGATKPWGIGRTYPNVLGYEAVLGMERSKFNARDTPIHRATLPFTRMLAAPMDYTPGGFDNVTEDAYFPRNIHPMVMGTRAQQLALYVVYRAPFQMVSDAPSAYAGQRAFQFIRDVPETWDETRALNGLPAEFITIARRNDRNWFLGSITNWSARDLTLPLDFLGKGEYRAEIYEDGPDADRNPKHVSIRQQTVRSTDHLTVHLARGGGCAIRFHFERE